MLRPKLQFLRLLLLSKPVITLSLLAASLASCATVSTGVAPGISLACKAYGAGISYDSTRDTAQTVQQIRVHNKSFENLGCKL